MKTIYNNTFLDQHSNENSLKGSLVGAGVGSLAGGGLGTLFASLAGGNPMLGALGSVPGAFAGAAIGNSISQRKNASNRAAAYAMLGDSAQQKALRDFAAQMDAASGTNEFSQWAATDPQGFTDFMLKNA